MAWIAAIISAVAGGAASSKQKSAAKKSRLAQEAGQRDAAGNIQQGYDTAIAGLKPYSQIGNNAILGLGELTGQKGYRTAEEQSYTDFINQGQPEYVEPTLENIDMPGKYKITPGSKEAIKMGGLQALDTGAFLRSKSKKKKQSRAAQAQAALEQQAAAARLEQAKVESKSQYEKELSDWNTRKAEMEAASTASLANYDPMAVLQKTPGYMARYQQGQQGVENTQAGRSLGGRAVKETQKYGQDYASNEYNNEFNRRLSLANVGQNANNAIGNWSVGQGTGLANISANTGNINAQSGQSESAYYNDINSVLQKGIGDYQSYQSRKKTETPTYSSAYTPGQTLDEYNKG